MKKKQVGVVNPKLVPDGVCLRGNVEGIRPVEGVMGDKADGTIYSSTHGLIDRRKCVIDRREKAWTMPVIPTMHLERINASRHISNRFFPTNTAPSPTEVFLSEPCFVMASSMQQDPHTDLERAAHPDLVSPDQVHGMFSRSSVDH